MERLVQTPVSPRARGRAPDYGAPGDLGATLEAVDAVERAAGGTWRASAACLGTDPAIFYPVPPRGASSAVTYAAPLAICAGCPVREPCALAGADEKEGMFGGLTPGQRRRRLAS